MTEPHRIDPDRLEQLLHGAPPADDAERDLVAMLADIRAAHPGPPDRLRATIDALAAADPPPRAGAGRLAALRARLASAGSRRRLLAVGAPLAAAVIALAVIVPVSLQDDGTDGAAPPAEMALERATGIQGAPPAEGTPAPAMAPEPAADAAGAVPGTIPAPDPGRAQQVTTRTRVLVDDVDALSRAATRAMGDVRALGGFTATSELDVPHAGRGSARMTFRVPAARAGDAIEAFGRLGTIIAQDARIQDVTDRIARAGDAIDRLRARVDDLRARAAAAPRDAGLRAALARAEAQLARRDAARAATAARARLATLHLDLTTTAPAAAPDEPGALIGAVSDAWDRLHGALARIAGALVLLSPALIAALVALGLTRRARRRAVARLLDG